jgi:hypothetical protein
MKRPIVVVLLCCVAFLLMQCGDLLAQDPQNGQNGQGQNGQGQNGQEQEGQNGPPPNAAIHWAKGQGPSRFGSGANMTWHGGNVMGSAAVRPIFWGLSWNNANFVGDKITGLATFYSGMGSSAYAMTSDEYSGVTAAITYNGNVVDYLSQAANGSSTSAILNEVCKEVSNPVSNGFYPVYVDLKRGNAGYCAWHSVGTCGSTQVQFAFFFNLDGDAGCDPQDGSGLHSQGLAALANVSGHELSEARTDPALNAWYDVQGNENADKCAWSFGSPLLTFTDGSQWKVQGNWSNNAYNHQTGYPNLKGQRGCIDGSN